MRIRLLIALAIALGCNRIELVTTTTFDCTRDTKNFLGQRKVWGAFKQQPDGPELVACFGGLMLSEDNEKACKASLEFLGDAFHCAAFQ